MWIGIPIVRLFCSHKYEKFRENDKYVINILYEFKEYCLVRHIRNQVLLNEIGFRIKALREKSNLTQEEVFNDTKIHIGRIETATSNVTVSTLEAICKYFDIGLEQLFKGL